MAGLAEKPQVVEKQETTEELKGALQGATISLIADYRGLTVSELTALRRELLKEGARFTVAKNTLLRRAAQETGNEALVPFLKGPTAMLVGTGDQVAPVKILKDFLKKNKKPNEIRGGMLDGKALSPREVDELATMPSLDVLRGKLLGCIASPMNGIVSALSSPQRALVNVLDQYAKKQSGS